MSDKGHNNTLTEQESKALFWHHYEKVAEADAEIKAAQKKKSDAKKTAKADGILGKDLEFAIKLVNADDGSIFVEEMKRQARIAGWLALPVSFQADLFVDRQPLADKAYTEGEAAGYKGESLNNPYDPSTKDAYDAFAKGWHAAQKTMRDDLQSALEKKNQQREMDKAGPDKSESEEVMDGDQDPGFEDEGEEA